MIRTKSIYEPIHEDDGIRVLITRYWPRGVKRSRVDRWYNDLSPSKKLLHDFKLGKINSRMFEKLFIIEMSKNNNVGYLCKQLASEVKLDKNVTLLCYEMDENNCHRRIIRNFCENEL